MAAGAQGVSAGPLAGIRVIEMAGIGPVPLAGLILSDLGATVVRVERARSGPPLLPLAPEHNMDVHGRLILKVDLKRTQGRDLILDMAEQADILLEGFRPGVMERLGLGPHDLAARNSRLVYGRMTGFGQDGPLSDRAGHDLTYLAYTGVLDAIGHAGSRPVPPLNLVADYGGGSMFLLAGVLSALVARQVSGRGQVVDAAMIDGASMLAAPYFGFLAAGFWSGRRGTNLLDSGAPFYDTYETSDGRYVAVACLEPQFFAEFARLLPLPADLAARQYDRAAWPQMRATIAERFLERTRDAWAEIFEPTDACVAPVLSFAEARSHPHMTARGAHRRSGAVDRPAPAPRFSTTPAASADVQLAASTPPSSVISAFGIGESQIQDLLNDGTVVG